MIMKRAFDNSLFGWLANLPVTQFRWSVFSAWLLVFTVSVVAWSRLLDIVRSA